MNKYQRIINQITRYDIKIDKMAHELHSNFKEVRIVNRFLAKDLDFQELLEVKKLALKLLKEFQNNYKGE